MSEKSLHEGVAYYLRYQYPGILFNSDMAGSQKLTERQAGDMKKLRSNRGFPDIAIYEPRQGYHGLFIELKAEGTRIHKKDGITPANDHIAEQREVMQLLREKGYLAGFAVGFENAKAMIDNYLR